MMNTIIDNKFSRIINRDYYRVCFFFFLLMTGCEQEIPLDFPEYSRKLVVEGWIEQGQPARVMLSYNAPYFSGIDSVNLRDYAATRAKVTLTCGDTSEILTLKPNDIYFPPIYYFSTSLFGSVNDRYEITIENAGHTYTASTTIPEPVYPDSVWFDLVPGEDSLGTIWLRISDDPYMDNYYRTFVKRKGKDKKFIPTLTSAFSDELFSGEVVTHSLTRGSANLLELGESRYFELGDTLIFKLCTMDREHYEFWNSLQSHLISSANPFASNKSEIISNIDGGLGVWGGYAAVYDTIIAR